MAMQHWFQTRSVEPWLELKELAQAVIGPLKRTIPSTTSHRYSSVAQTSSFLDVRPLAMSDWGENMKQLRWSQVVAAGEGRAEGLDQPQDVVKSLKKEEHKDLVVSKVIRMEDEARARRWTNWGDSHQQAHNLG
ncbi:uncharacterized protein AKAME5_001703700 [Lates japonicus]|uniref:Uncharacterized protein n=1 Tax=Lates japonicus TaxID=270547 RepID=A0AAD3RF38_LATJO|nr:uncharacterized protein AKAME5_001703700 [Lates japonicus]